MQVNEFKPLIVAFCCNWCSYAGADLAGNNRLTYFVFRFQFRNATLKSS